MAKGKQMKVLEDKLDFVRREIDKLRAQETLLLEMMDEASGETKVKIRAPRANVKQTIIKLLEEVGDTGLNATTAVEMAEAKGIALNRGSVSSLLSRLANDKVVTYDGTVYRLAQPRTMPALPSVVHPIRTSGGGM